MTSKLIDSVTPHLLGKLDGSVVKTREQANRKLSYIEGWYAIDQANLIFGFGNWDQEIIKLECVYAVQQEDEVKKYNQTSKVLRWHVSYIAHCRIIVDGVVREDVGNGHGIDKDGGLAHESAAKEAMTDAMKRAFRTFGNKFGLALYDKDQSNVATNKYELICSDGIEFTRYILDAVNSEKITDIGKQTILALAKVNTIPEIPEKFRARVLDIINNKPSLSLVNEGKHPKTEEQIVDPNMKPEETTEQLEKAVEELAGTFILSTSDSPEKNKANE